MTPVHSPASQSGTVQPAGGSARWLPLGNQHRRGGDLGVSSTGQTEETKLHLCFLNLTGMACNFGFNSVFCATESRRGPGKKERGRETEPPFQRAAICPDPTPSLSECLQLRGGTRHAYSPWSCCLLAVNQGSYRTKYPSLGGLSVEDLKKCLSCVPLWPLHCDAISVKLVAS